MKKIFTTALIAAALIVSGSMMAPKVHVIRAQSLPVTRPLAWDANPTVDNVLDYTVRLDGIVVGTATTPTLPVTFSTPGVHTLTVVARNVWGVGVISDTLTVDVRVPGKVNNVRIP